MTKIVYNNCFGGFGLSDEAFEKLLDLKGIAWSKEETTFGSSQYHNLSEEEPEYLYRYRFYEDRSDPDLVKVVEELGSKANNSFSELVIYDVPEGSRYRIEEYDGNESVMKEEEYAWLTA